MRTIFTHVKTTLRYIYNEERYFLLVWLSAIVIDYLASKGLPLLATHLLITVEVVLIISCVVRSTIVFHLALALWIAIFTGWLVIASFFALKSGGGGLTFADVFLSIFTSLEQWSISWVIATTAVLALWVYRRFYLTYVRITPPVHSEQLAPDATRTTKQRIPPKWYQQVEQFFVFGCGGNTYSLKEYGKLTEITFSTEVKNLEHAFNVAGEIINVAMNELLSLDTQLSTVTLAVENTLTTPQHHAGVDVSFAERRRSVLWEAIVRARKERDELYRQMGKVVRPVLLGRYHPMLIPHPFRAATIEAIRSASDQDELLFLPHPVQLRLGLEWRRPWIEVFEFTDGSRVIEVKYAEIGSEEWISLILEKAYYKLYPLKAASKKCRLNTGESPTSLLFCPTFYRNVFASGIVLAKLFPPDIMQNLAAFVREQELILLQKKHNQRLLNSNDYFNDNHALYTTVENLQLICTLSSQ